MTARDVKFTLDLYAHPEVLWAAPGAYEVRVLDDSTYTVRYGETVDAEVPIGSPLDWYYPIYPAHLLRDEDPARFHDWEFWRQPLGNGPYRLVRRVPETGLVFEADPDFALGPPAIDRLLVRSGGSSLVELRAGTVDAIGSVPDSDVPKLRADERFALYHAFHLGSFSAILWNHRRPPFEDPAVRRALTMAIDRRAILEFLNAPAGLEPTDILLSEEAFRIGRMPPGVPYDPETARAIDRRTRAMLFGELGDVLRRDLPFTVLSPMVTWTAADRHLRGLSSPWRADPAWYMDALWWEGDRLRDAAGSGGGPRP